MKRIKPPTREQLMNASFNSHEKCLAVGDKPTEMQCGECDGRAISLPALTMRAPFSGTLICPHCWHPVIGRLLATFARHGTWCAVRSKKWDAQIRELTHLGLLEARGRSRRLTPAGLAVLWLKESVGWEFESAHARGWYRTERFHTAGKHTGYFANDGKWGQFIPHHAGSHSKPWPLGGIGVLRFTTRAA